MGPITTKMILVSDSEYKRAPGEVDFYLTWTSFSILF